MISLTDPPERLNVSSITVRTVPASSMPEIVRDIRNYESWVYLTVFLDLYMRQIAGQLMQSRINRHRYVCVDDGATSKAF